jgi:transcriptional regulator with XRE-family HTH domain
MGTQTTGWARTLHTGIARAVRAARGKRSAQWLADETDRLGHPVSRNEITNYENGRKHSLDVADLLILAAALRIPPVLLLFADFPDTRVELLPGVGASAEDAVNWLSGRARLPTTRVDDDGTGLVAAVGGRAIYRDALTHNRLEQVRYADKPAVVKDLQLEAERFRARLEEINVDVREAQARLWGADEEENDG